MKDKEKLKEVVSSVNNDIKINEKTMFNYKIIIIIAIVCLVIAIPIGFAYFSDKKEEQKGIRIGEIEVILEEDWPRNPDDPYYPNDPNNKEDIPQTPTVPGTPIVPFDENGSEKYTKKAWGKSIAELDAYVRIKCIPIVQYNKDGEWITAPVSQENIKLTVKADNWTQKDGYWYYNKILKGYQNTDSIDVDWKILEIPSEYSNYLVRADVRVILEYAQTTNGMWKKIFNISELPESVERVEE